MARGSALLAVTLVLLGLCGRALAGVPSVILSSAVATHSGIGFTATATFSEGVTGFTVNDLTTTRCDILASSWNAVSATVYEFTVQPTTAANSITVLISAGKASSVATSQDNTLGTKTWSFRAPVTPVVDLTSTINTHDQTAFTVTATFSADLTGSSFALGDVACAQSTTSCSVSSLVTVTADRVFTFTVTPGAAATDLTLTIAADGVTSALTSTGNLAESKVWTHQSGPTVSVFASSAASHDESQYTVTCTFSEAVGGDNDGLTVSDIGCSGCTVDRVEQESANGQTYTIYITDTTPGSETQHTISLAAAKAYSASGNRPNKAATNIVLPFKPSVVISTTDGTTLLFSTHGGTHDGSNFVATATFSHAMTAGTFATNGDDISFNGCAISGSVTVVSALVYTWITTPSAGTQCQLSIAAGGVSDDDSSITNEASNSLAVNFSPSVIISASQNYHDQTSAVTFTATFTPGIGNAGSTKDFLTAEFVISGCTAGAFVEATADTVFTKVCTPTGSADMVATIAAGVGDYDVSSTDYDNVAALAKTVYEAVPAPTLVATDGNTGTHDGGTSNIAMAVTWDAPVTGFTYGDITLDNGAVVLSNTITADTSVAANTRWTFTIDMSGITVSTSPVTVKITGSKAAAQYGSANNVPSNVLQFTYKTQWGLVSIASIKATAANGNTAASLAGTATTQITATLEAYKFNDWVEVCLQRDKDDDISASALASYLWIRVDLEAGDNIRVYSDPTNSALGGQSPVDQVGSSTLGASASAHSNSDTGFDVVWEDATDGAQRCFKVGLRDTTNWVTAAADMCSAAANFQLNLEAYHVGATSGLLSGAGCLVGTDTGGCAANERYFANGLSSIVVARSVTQNPVIKLVDVTTAAGLFPEQDQPPALNEPVYAQDTPKLLVVFERTCNEDKSTVADDAALYSTVTTMTLASVFDDLSYATGLNAKLDFQDVSADFVAQGGSKSWASLRDVSWTGGDSTVAWTGGACGAAEGDRRFVLIKIGDGTSIAAPMRGEVDFDSAIASNTGGSECAADDFTAPAPAVVVSLYEDPTRDSTSLEDGTQALDADLRSFFGDISFSGTDMAFEVGQRLHLSGDNTKKALHVVGMGSCIPLTGSAYRFPHDSLAKMCTNVPDNFEAALVSGAVTDANLFDALFSTGVYHAGPIDSAGIGAGNLATYPLYPFGGVNDVFSSSSAWISQRFSSSGGLFNVDTGETTAGRWGARWNASATIDELRACKTFAGVDTVTSSNDLDTGVTTFSFSVFSQIIGAKGTNLNDRDWQQMSCETKDYTITFDNDVSGTAWVESDDLDISVDLLDVTAVSTSDCNYASDSGTTLDIDETEFACDCGGSCPASAVTQRLQYRVMVDIERMANPDTGGDVGIRDMVGNSALRFIPIPGRTCYGLEVSSDYSNVQFVDAHEAAETYNRFILTANTAPISMYSTVLAANDPEAFTRCQTATNADIFDFRVPMRKIKGAGVSWETALAARYVSSRFVDHGNLELRVRFFLKTPLVTSSLVGTDGSGGFTETTVELYLDPDVLTDGTASVEARSPLTANNGPVHFNVEDNIVVTHRVVHDITKNMFTLHIKDAIVCSLQPTSTFYDCVHPSVSGGTAGASVAGGSVSQEVCPTGSDAWLEFSCDYDAWDAYATANSKVNPIASSFNYARFYAPLLNFQGTHSEAFMCKYSLKSETVKNKLGTKEFFCENYANDEYKCGASSNVHTAVKQVLFAPGGNGGAVAAAAQQWDQLSGLTSSGPFRAADAIEIPLAGLPSSATTNNQYFVSLRSTLYDCGDGSENNGARRLAAGGAAEFHDLQALSLRGNGRELEVVTSHPGASGMSSASSTMFAVSTDPNNVAASTTAAGSNASGSGSAAGAADDSIIWGLNGLQLAGVIVGAVAGLSCIAIVVFLVVRKYKGYEELTSVDFVSGAAMT